MRFQAYFFDMDGVLLDSMPNHTIAWQETLVHYGIDFQPRDCYINEGMTSRDVIRMLAARQHVAIREDQLEEIYQAKTAAYRQKGGGKAMAGMKEVLEYIHNQGPQMQIWVVTGGGQPDLYEQLEGFYPGIFNRQHFITAYDIVHGKPDPESYIKAWERSGLDKSQCCVVENAPLGIHAGKGAGLFTIGVNTGVLTLDDLRQAGADAVFNNMYELGEWLMVNG